MRKWVPLLLIAIAYLVSALLFSRLPTVVTPDWGVLFPFVADSNESGSRVALALLMPTIALAAYLLFVFLRSSLGERLSRAMFSRWAPPAALDSAAIVRFERTYELIVTLLVAFVVLMHITLIGRAAGWGDWLPRLFAVLVGLGVVTLGNVMPRLRPNPIMGVRTRKTLNDPRLWARTHRVFGALFVISGVVTIVLALSALQYALLAGFTGILVACLAMLFYLRGPESR
jgi:hypothetical protein